MQKRVDIYYLLSQFSFELIKIFLVITNYSNEGKILTVLYSSKDLILFRYVINLTYLI